MLLALLAPSLVWLQTAVGLELLLWVWTLPAFIFCTLPLRTRQSDQEAQNQGRRTPTPHGSHALIMSRDD
jgi:hypothetical protein